MHGVCVGVGKVVGGVVITDPGIFATFQTLSIPDPLISPGLRSYAE
jgi:hypothetical protein